MIKVKRQNKQVIVWIMQINRTFIKTLLIVGILFKSLTVWLKSLEWLIFYIICCAFSIIMLVYLFAYYIHISCRCLIWIVRCDAHIFIQLSINAQTHNTICLPRIQLPVEEYWPFIITCLPMSIVRIPSPVQE